MGLGVVVTPRKLEPKLSRPQNETMTQFLLQSTHVVDWKMIAIKNSCDFDETLQIVNCLYCKMK